MLRALPLLLWSICRAMCEDVNWHPSLQGKQDTVSRIKELRNIPAPALADRSVATAKALHQDAMYRAMQIGRLAGHRRVAPSLQPVRRVAAKGAGMIDPVAYGADPTGHTDSSPAFARALAALLNETTHTKKMAVNITDLGGVTLDLGGGEYLISQPLELPPFFGNYHFRSGTLRASSSFPADKWLVMVGDNSCVPKLPSGGVDGQGACVEFVTFEDMLFDSAHVAAGGLNIAKAMGATVGPSTFFIGFKREGIKVDGGHEVMIVDTWLAECYWSKFSPLAKTDPCSPEWTSESVGIQINGPDAYLENVIVFGFARVGVEINGHANVLYGVHTWNSAPLPPTFKAGTGISLGGPNSPYNDHNDNRIIGCYLDFNTLDMYDPSHTIVEDTFFLGTHAILYPLHRLDTWGDAAIEGLVMRHNTYTTDKSVVLAGPFKSIKNVIISDEINAAKATRARKSLTLKGATRWEFDFSDSLLFPSIEQITYSVSSDGAFFQHLARTPQGTKVVVETSAAVDATVVVEAVQGIDYAAKEVTVV